LGKRSNNSLSDSVSVLLVTGVVVDGRAHPIIRHPAITIVPKFIIISLIAERSPSVSARNATQTESCC
jgi:hypothetical protein